MHAYKCNKCRNAIKEPHRDGHISLTELETGFGRVDFCHSCSPGFLQFLKKYAKIKGKNDKKR